MEETTARYRRRVDPARQGFDFDEWPFYHMVRLIAQYHLKIEAPLKSIGIDVSIWRVMTVLDVHKVVTISQIAAEAVTKISTMAKIIQRMTDQGLVTTRVSADDARSTEVLLTAEGKRTYDLARERIGLIARQAFDNVTDEEIQFINAVSRKIFRNIAH